MKRHVIIGNSHAAISAVQAIRSVNSEDKVILISREDCPAYSPMLTPCYLSGSMPYEGMFFCDAAFYRINKVDTLLGKRVVKVTPKSKSVSLDDGTSISYDTLLIATGSTSRVPPVPGTQLPNVFTLWTAEDARRIGDAMRGAETVAIVGAGLIGIDCVNVAVGNGKKVALIEMLGQVMPQAVDTEGSRIVEARMMERGVKLHLNERLLGIEARRGRLSLSLASGTRVQADVAIMATGVAPSVELLEGSGVKVASGAVVNEYCETSVPGVYAAGDVAEAVDGATGQSRVNATILNAAEQGRVAGLNMAGVRAPCLRTVQVNAFTPLGLPCISIGEVSGVDGRHQELSSRSGESYRKLVFDGGRLIGAVLIGEVEYAGILANLIERHESHPNLRKELEKGNVSLTYAKALAGAV